MSNKNNASRSSGLSFTGALTIAFIVLKLCGVISWSWLWVLSPIWISFLLLVVIIFIALVVVRLTDEHKPLDEILKT